MIKTFSDFKAVCEKKREQLFNIPAAYLSEEGLAVRNMYRFLDNACVFAETASELLAMVGADPDFILYAEKAPKEYSLIRGCLEQLAN